MVRALRQILLAALITVLFSAGAYAASFTARVDRKEVAVGESFTLDLKLSGASPEGRPDFDPLRETFTVYSQGQSSQTTIINNKMSSSINWQLILIPAEAGTVTIPAITLQTDVGVLQSQPLTVNVTKASTSADAANRTVFVQTELGKADPYQNEPVLFTAKLVARRSIANVNAEEFKIEGAVVEQQGEPRVYDGVLQGQPVKVVEVNYLVTPLNAGPIIIPPYIFKGQVEMPRSAARGNDPFRMMEQMFPGFAGFEIFAVASEESLLDVRPPAVKMDPWLPLTGLEIADHIEGLKTATAGQPLTRTITIAATGTVGAALPNLEDEAAPQEGFKVYADNPEVSDSVGDDGIVTGWREERYTLIPEHEGVLTLPEIKVPWWDLGSGKVRYATVPARTVTVRPASTAGTSPGALTTRIYPENMPAAQDGNAQATSEYGAEPGMAGAEAPPEKAAYLLYIVIALLGAGVVVLTGVVIYLYRTLAAARLRRQRPGGTRMAAAANQDRITAADLKQAETPEALRGFLQAYASQYWGLPRNSALKAIAAALDGEPEGLLDRETRDVLLALDAALYGGGSVDTGRAKALVAALLKKAGPKSLSGARVPQKRHGLNPS